ncbi:MAG: MFS transporter [Spirochaetaceae bacterium]
MSSVQAQRLSTGRKIGYGLGDLYGGGAFFIVSTLYLIFLTDVVGIRPGLAGLVVLIARGWDAVSDPIMGMISDRTDSRWGRRRPYFLIGIPFIVLSFVALWYPTTFEAEAARFAYALASYLFFSTIITMVMVPYNALASELTLDYADRSGLTTVRMAFSQVSTLVCALVPLLIVNGAPTRALGYPIMGLVFGLFFALPFIATFLATRERPEFTRRTTPGDLKAFLEPFRIRSFRLFILMFLFSFAAIDIVLSVIVFFVTHYLQVPEITNLLLGTLLIVQLVCLPLYYRLSTRFSKVTSFVVGAVVWAVAMLSSLLLGPETPRWLFFVFAGLVGTGTGGVVVMAYAIFPDIPDVDELISGHRREGIFAGVQTFLRKLTGAFAIFLVGQAIELAGYRPPVEATEAGLTTVTELAQTPQFLLILRLVFAFVPILFIGFLVIVSLRFPLTPARHDELKALLARRREAGGTFSEADEQTARELVDILA